MHAESWRILFLVWILNSMLVWICDVYMVVNQVLHLLKYILFKLDVIRTKLLLEVSKWDDACNRRSKGWGKSNLLGSLNRPRPPQPPPPPPTFGKHPRIIPSPWIFFFQIIQVMRCADFRPMLNNKFFIVIKTVMNYFLYPCKFTAVNFYKPLDDLF